MPGKEPSGLPRQYRRSSGSVAACALATAADEKAIDRATNEIVIVSGEMDVARHDPIEARSCKFGITGDAAPRLKRRPGAVDCSMDTCDVHRVDQHREWIGVARNAVVHGQGLSLRLVNHRLGTPRDAPGSSSLRQKSAPPARPGGTRLAETRFDDGPVRLTSLVGNAISKAYLPTSRSSAAMYASSASIVSAAASSSKAPASNFWIQLRDRSCHRARVWSVSPPSNPAPSGA